MLREMTTGQLDYTTGTKRGPTQDKEEEQKLRRRQPPEQRFRFQLFICT